MRFLQKILMLIVSTCLLSACGNDKNSLKVGTISGPETELMQVAKKIAKEKYNLNIVIVEFSDYTEPNAALADGSLNANMFQHKPYLDQQIKDRGYKLVPIAKTFIYPMGIYSSKIKDIAQTPLHAIVAIPNDPSNEDRALLLLQKAKLIQLKASADFNATPKDIVSNPKQLVFKELDASLIPRSLPDVTLAAINANYALTAGLSSTDAIFYEGADSPYVNLIVVRESEQNDPRFKDFISAFQSPEVIDAAKKLFNNQAIPAWK